MSMRAAAQGFGGTPAGGATLTEEEEGRARGSVLLSLVLVGG
jgi:hypothetical protein